MTQMDARVVSREYVKPISPTPRHLRVYELSLLDQVIPPVYSPIILFFPKASHSKSCVPLKKSLAESLSRFYPLAGRIKDAFSVECNDEGAAYVEAKMHSSLSAYLNQRDSSSMHKLLPREFNWYVTGPGSHVLIVQVTNFSCGGFSIGLLIAHMVVDGTSVSCFLRDWASSSRQAGHEIVLPMFGAASMFPQAVPFPAELSLPAFWSRFLRKTKTAQKRLVFDSVSINVLKAKARSSSLKDPTRVEVVSAFLCKSIMSVFRRRNHRPTVVTQAVNMRKRADPPLPACLIGNFPWLAIKLFANNDQDDASDISTTVVQLRQATAMIDATFVRSLQGDKAVSKIRETMNEMRSLGLNSPAGVDYVGFTSLCNMGGYDQLDFGSGRPILSTFCTDEAIQDGPLINTVFLVDTREGRGIEALVLLDHEEIAALEQDKELLAYANVDPNPLSNNRPDQCQINPVLC